MSCVLCPPEQASCEFCAPDIPAEYNQYSPKYRNHHQLVSVKKGLHPSGHRVYPLKSITRKCRDCTSYLNHPQLPKSYGYCRMAIDDEHRIILGKYTPCEHLG